MFSDQFCNLTWKLFTTWRFQDSNKNTSSVSNTGYRGQPKQDSKYESNQNACQLLAFKKSIKREVSQYTILKDEKYFEAFKRNLLVTATTHEILEGDYRPGYDDDSQELFQQKQYFMYSILNIVLQSDMGKTIVRKYAPTLDSQPVWKEFETHMSTSSKGVKKRCRLYAYVSNTVYDRSWKCTTEQFVLHFHKQFRQLDELTPLDEQLPHSVRLTLLQTAVRISELRTVETMEEYMSLTHFSSGHFSITYDKFFMMLQNTCIRYDKTVKQKPFTTFRAVYQHELDEDPSVHMKRMTIWMTTLHQIV